MQIQYINKPLLDPYRSLGLVVTSKITLQTTPTLAFAAPTNNSYKIYTEKLAIQNISPNFSDPILAILSQNDTTFVRLGQKLIQMQYYHIINQWNIGSRAIKSNILKMGEAIILAQNKKIIIITDTIQQIQLDFDIIDIIHPNTYINKVIVYGYNKFQLWNISSHKLIYDFSNLIQNKQSDQIIRAEASSTPDVIGISLKSGKILFHNIKSDVTLFELKQKNAAISMSFSRCTRPILATGDSLGHIIFWDLNEKKIIGKIQYAHKGQIISLIFLPNQLLLLSASCEQNSIKQWKYDQIQKNSFRLLRQRNSIRLPISSFSIQSNLEVVLNTPNQSLYLSFISENNSYLLPRCLDSKLPTHISAKGHSIQVYHNQTLTKTIPIQQIPLIGRITISQNYYIIATQTRILRVGSGDTLDWKIRNALSIGLYHQHFIYVLTKNTLNILDFVNSAQPIKRIEIDGGLFLVQNLWGNFLAIAKQKGIQIWDMKNCKKGREFSGHQQQILCLSFSTDNKHLFSSAKDKTIKIWDIISNVLYKTIFVEQNVIYHSLTPDNRFFVSAFSQSRQIKIWHNLIGNISSSIEEQNIKFETSVTKMDSTLRKYLNKKNLKEQYQLQQQQFQLEKYLDTVQDADDQVGTFTQLPKGKWMPLIFYDEIKQRNRPSVNIQKKIEAPFFLDFEKKDEQMKKIQKQYEQQLKNHSRILEQNRNKHLKSSKNSLILQRDLSQYNQILNSLKQLTPAELDYQFRNFLLNPLHLIKLATFFKNILTQITEYDIKIVYFNRFLQILGSDILNEQLSEILNKIKSIIEKNWARIQKKLYLSQIVCQKNIA